jgi:hypothetical protein
LTVLVRASTRLASSPNEGKDCRLIQKLGYFDRPVRHQHPEGMAEVQKLKRSKSKELLFCSREMNQFQRLLKLKVTIFSQPLAIVSSSKILSMKEEIAPPRILV